MARLASSSAATSAPPTSVCSMPAAALVIAPNEFVHATHVGLALPSDRMIVLPWGMDLPADLREIAPGSLSNGVTARGKPGPETADGARHGINDYTAWFAGDDSMAGDYYGYDGPCPPWNDSVIHHYVFTVYALDVEGLQLSGRFSGGEARKAIETKFAAR